MGVGRGSSTQVLIGDYSSQYPGGGAGAGSRAPLRTPLQENIIMQEARNQLAFRDMTPLAGMGLGCVCVDCECVCERCVCVWEGCVCV